MQFRSITITNLFSYYGENSLLLNPNNSCNITVLKGRNGYGKTSFINSVKMLFVDTAEEIRRTVQRRRVPTSKQFVMGIANEWWGILNQQARKEGITTCSVSAVWVDSYGYTVHTVRKWDLSISHESTLILTHDLHGELVGFEASDFLENQLPKSFLPFFFFDGEEVQEIAEANDNEVVRKIELLLNIRPLDSMQESLNQLANEWMRKGQNETAKKALRDKERELEERFDQKAIYEQKIKDLDIESELQKDQLKKVNRNLQWLRGGVTQEAEAQLKTEIKNKQEQRDNILENLAMYWKQDAVLAVHPIFIKKALGKLEALIHSSQGEQEALLNAVKQRLASLFEMPPFPTPQINSNQATFYNKRITRELEAIGVMDAVEEGYDINYDLGKKLFKQLNQYENNNLIGILQQEASRAQSLWFEIHDLKNKLQATGKLSEEKQHEYEQLLHQEQEIKEKVIKHEVSRNFTEKELGTLERSITVSSQELSILQSALRVATEFRKQHDFSKRLRAALEEVKNKLKSLKRKELEDTYNKHLSTLLDSHGLIAKVVIDESFEISYRTDEDELIGMSTVSAGMKQLSATALLWALKDISGRDFPIIIDTPMGRIDAKHQENLLTRYYPKVAKQVILLPTDSELDRDKLKILKPHICKLYELRNPTGKSASIEDLKEY